MILLKRFKTTLKKRIGIILKASFLNYLIILNFILRMKKNLWKKLIFPFLEEHRRVHKELANKTKNLLLVNDIDISNVIEQLSILTKSWILNHVYTEDILINNYLTRLIYTGEIHYTLEQYINLKK